MTSPLAGGTAGAAPPPGAVRAGTRTAVPSGTTAAPAGPPGPPAPRRRRRTVVPYLLLLPALVPVVVGLGYPLVRQLVLSFQEYGLAQQFGRSAEWVGLDNYTTLLTDPYVWTVIARSVAFCLVNAALTMVVGMALAVLMARVGRAARMVLQVCLLLAWGTPVLATMTVWQWLFDSQYGVINWLLAEPLGLEAMRGHSWIIEPLSFYFVATVIVVWMSVPFVVLTVYAGLLQVPTETMEAAHLDGWGLVNRVLGLTIVYVAAVLPFTVWMLRGFVSGIPLELEEAATVDGLSRTGAFFRITFPLLAPGLVASGVYGFLQAWNEYTLALVVMTDPARRTLPLWLQGLVEANRATDWGVVMAGATLIAVPVIAFFLLVQHRMTAGLVSGAVKG